MPPPGAVQGCWFYFFGAGNPVLGLDETGAVRASAGLPSTFPGGEDLIVLTYDELRLFVVRDTNTLCAIATSNAAVTSYTLVNDFFRALAVAPDFVYVGTETSLGTHRDVIDGFNLTSNTDAVQFNLTGGLTDLLFLKSTTDGANLVAGCSPPFSGSPPESVFVVRTPANTVVPVSGTDSPGAGKVYLVASDMVILPDNSKAYIPFGSYDGGITSPIAPFGVFVVDIATATLVATISLTRPANSIGVAASGSYVYLTTQSDAHYTVIDTSTDTIAATLTSGGGTIAACIAHPNSNTTNAFGLAFDAAGNIYVDVIDIATPSITHTTTIAAGSGTAVVGFSGAVTLDGLKLFISLTNSGHIRIVDTTSFVATATLTPSNNSWPIPGPVTIPGGWHIGEAPIGTTASGGWRSGMLP